MPPGLEIVGADASVPLAGGGRIAYANLDHGASAPALRVVKDTVDALLERYASVHRGAGWHSKICTRCTRAPASRSATSSAAAPTTR